MRAELIKTTSAYKALLKDIKSNRLGHAYLLISSDSVARDIFLLQAAMAIMCKRNGCGFCSTCLKIASSNHVDIKYIAVDSKIKVKDINDLVEDAQISSIEGGKKIYIINNAESMSASAQNKLLKTYEEPNDNTVIFLAANNDSSILPTIKSRAKKLYLNAFSSKAIVEELMQSGITKEKAEVIAAYAQGSIEKAEKMGEVEEYQQYFLSVMDVLLTLKNSKQIIDYIYLPIFSKENINVTLDFLEIILSDVLTLRSGADVDLKIVNKDYDLNQIKKNFSSAGLAVAILAINEGRKMLQYNVNTTSVTEKILFDILEAGYKWR